MSERCGIGRRYGCVDAEQPCGSRDSVLVNATGPRSGRLDASAAGEPASPAQARSVSHGYATDELRVQKSPSDDATRRRMAQKSPYRAESAVLLRGAAGTSGAQKLVTRPTGRPEEGTTATGGAQRAEVVELGKSDVQWPGGFSVAFLRPSVL